MTPGNKGLGSLEAKSCDKEKNREAEGWGEKEEGKQKKKVCFSYAKCHLKHTLASRCCSSLTFMWR